MSERTGNAKYQAGALYAVHHSYEWHLAEWDGEVFQVIGTGMQSGDRWLPEWVERVVFVADQYEITPGEQVRAPEREVPEPLTGEDAVALWGRTLDGERRIIPVPDEEDNR